MKISTAISLGSLLVIPVRGVYLTSDEKFGCAWGMAAKAAPSEINIMFSRSNAIQVALPCGCYGVIMGNGARWENSDGNEPLGRAIIHLFNYHVQTTKDWTLQKLVDWVALVEPPDPCETSVAEPALKRSQTRYSPELLCVGA